MDTTTVHTADPQQLARLLDPENETITVYHGTDPGLILQHQLKAPLMSELLSPILNLPEQALEIDPVFGTVEDLLQHPHPPIELLKRAKDFAKVCRTHPELLPPEVATVLYYAVISAALVGHGVKITNLGDEEFGRGLEWAIGQSWVDVKTGGLLRGALEKVKG